MNKCTPVFGPCNEGEMKWLKEPKRRLSVYVMRMQWVYIVYIKSYRYTSKTHNMHNPAQWTLPSSNIFLKIIQRWYTFNTRCYLFQVWLPHLTVTDLWYWICTMTRCLCHVCYINFFRTITFMAIRFTHYCLKRSKYNTDCDDYFNNIIFSLVKLLWDKVQESFPDLFNTAHNTVSARILW